MLLIGINLTHHNSVANASVATPTNLYSQEVNATFIATKLNDTECSVCIDNKDVATRAIVPSLIQIDGKDYEITEIDLNGFMGSPNLKRVSLAVTVKKIGNSAFADCENLSSVFMPGVKEIGNYAFMRCPELKTITLPSADISLGAMLFRNNDTQVIVRATEAGENWHSNWNKNNANQNVIYQVNYRDNLILEPLYSSITRSAEPVGYSVAIGQPFDGDFYSEEIDNTIYVPSTNPEDGLPVFSIEMESFRENKCENLIVEYSDIPIYIDSGAFSYLRATNIYINRPIVYLESIDYSDNVENVFYKSTVQKVVLPDTISGICAGMFYDCKDLEQVSFIQPKDGTREVQESYLKSLPNTAEVKTPSKVSFSFIGQQAFRGATNISNLTITSNVQNVGSNIVQGWTNSQQIYLDFVCGKLPAYNSNTKIGWNENWRGTYAESNVEYMRYLLLLNANGGTVTVSEKEVTVDEEVGLLPEPTRSGAFFAGWYDANNKLYSPSKKYTNKSNTELYARWQYQITYVANGEQQVLMCDIDSYITLKSFDKDGYNGYFRDSNNNIKYSFGERYHVTRSNTFVAYYEEKPLLECIEVDENGTSYCAIYGPKQLKELSSVTTNREIRLKNDIDVSDTDWQPVELFGIFDGQGYTITFKNENVSGDADFGFFSELSGPVRVENTKFKARIITTVGNSSNHNVGVVAAKVFGTGSYIINCQVLSTIANPYYNNKNDNSVDILVLNPNTKVGGFVGSNGGCLEDCINYASIASYATIGGIVGENNWSIGYSENHGSIFFDHNGINNKVGGIAGVHNSRSYLYDCGNYGNLALANVSVADTSNKGVAIGQIIGWHKYLNGQPMTRNNSCSGSVSSKDNAGINTTYIRDAEAGYIGDEEPDFNGGSCVVAGTLITLADGRQVPVEQLNGDESLLVWNLHTGKFDVAPILFIDHDPARIYEIVNLYFSDGTIVKVVSEHGFWDCTLNQYVYLDNNASQYIGHWFNKQITDENGQLSWAKVQLTNVVISYEYNTTWSPVIYGHLCYYVNGMLSMPGGISGLFNIFEVDSETLKYDVLAVQADMETYGLFTYEELSALVPVTEEMFNAVEGQYLKIAIGKGMITIEQLQFLVQRYAAYF